MSGGYLRFALIDKENNVGLVGRELASFLSGLKGIIVQNGRYFYLHLPAQIKDI